MMFSYKGICTSFQLKCAEEAEENHPVCFCLGFLTENNKDIVSVLRYIISEHFSEQKNRRARMDTNASLTYSAINSAVFASVNVAISVFSILMNIFFVYCIVFQQNEQEQLKQPLNVLQGILVGCNITINACTLLNVCSSLFPSWDYFFVYQCMIYVMMASLTSSFWQNVFYYCQITPAQSHFICLRKNIRVFIYCALLINGVFYVCALSLFIGVEILQNPDSYNDTSTANTINYQWLTVTSSWYLIFLITFAFFILNMCGMSASSCATIIYLWKHLKNMEKSSTLSSPRFQRQIRMTIRSIVLHALINLICSLWFLIELNVSLAFDENVNVLCTIVSFYTLGTTITQGIAQSLYRQQIACAWKKCCFKKMFPMF